GDRARARRGRRARQERAGRALSQGPDDMTDPSGPSTRARVRHLVDAIGEADETSEERFVLEVSRSHRWLAPLAFVVGSCAMLFEGLKLVVTNWRLTLVQVLPAMWIWAAMLDLKIHVIHDKAFHVLIGPALVLPLGLAVAIVTAACFYLNAVFAFAIVQPGRPQIRP